MFPAPSFLRKPSRRALALLLSLVALAAAQSSAQPETDTLIQLEKSWAAALTANDFATLETMLGADLTYGHSSGKTDTKASYLNRMRSGAQKYIAFRYDPEMTARVYGNTALVNATARAESLTDGKPNSLHLRILHVWVKRDAAWELVAHQSAKLPD